MAKKKKVEVKWNVPKNYSGDTLDTKVLKVIAKQELTPSMESRFWGKMPVIYHVIETDSWGFGDPENPIETSHANIKDVDVEKRKQAIHDYKYRDFEDQVSKKGHWDTRMANKDISIVIGPHIYGRRSKNFPKGNPNNLVVKNYKETDGLAAIGKYKRDLKTVIQVNSGNIYATSIDGERKMTKKMPQRTRALLEELDELHKAKRGMRLF